jgi:uncharacterized protein (TIGR03437 family)
LNGGWRFCRFNGVVNRVFSGWSLVSPAPPFCLVLGPYWTTFGLRLSASAELFTPAVLVSGPALVSLSGDGCGQAAIFHTGTTDVAGLSDPVATASVDVYRTGLTTDAVLLPQVAVGDRMAAVVAMSPVPGSSGVSRVRIRVPSDIAPGSAVPVRVTYLDRPSNEVTMGVR